MSELATGRSAKVVARLREAETFHQNAVSIFRQEGRRDRLEEHLAHANTIREAIAMLQQQGEER